VYFPMSYQIGGYTLYMPRERLKPLDITVEEGMRLVLTGGISGEKGPPPPLPRSGSDRTRGTRQP
jgi:uncharacterized membrane protein